MSEIPEIRDNAAKQRYEAQVGNDVAFVQYSDKKAGTRLFVHTEVPQAFEGKGIGGRLVKAALDDARARGLRVVPMCPFVRSYIERHPEYGELIG